MQERFLSGMEDDYFDYDIIDNDQDYDDLRTQEVDEQENYFDEIEEDSNNNQQDSLMNCDPDY